MPDGGSTYTYDVANSVETYFVPPAGFNLATASAEELSLYHLAGYVAEAQTNPVAKAELSRVTFTAPTSFVATIPVQAIHQLANWAGHMADSGTTGEYSEADAFYDEPQLSSSRCSTNGEVTWAGLDGLGSQTSDLSQAGTGASQGGGTPGLGQHQSWSEVLPSQQSIQPQSVYATAGQEFYTSVAYEGGSGNNSQFWFQLLNEYTGSGTDFNVTANGWVGYSADWIIERPLVGGSYDYLSNFGTMTFVQTDGNYTDSMNLSDQYPVQMYSNGIDYADPSQLNKYGGFTVTQKDCGV